MAAMHESLDPLSRGESYHSRTVGDENNWLHLVHGVANTWSLAQSARGFVPLNYLLVQ